MQGNASPHCNPPGGFGLTCEITYSASKPLPCDGDALIRRCIEDCRSVGMIGSDDPIWAANQVDMPMAYVVYDHARAANVALVRDWLSSHDVILAGRYHDTFERFDDRWCFTDRLIHLDLVGDLSTHLHLDRLGGAVGATDGPTGSAPADRDR